MESENQHVRATIINMPYMLKRLEENMTVVRREIKNINKLQMEFLRMKNTVSEMKNTR